MTQYHELFKSDTDKNCFVHDPNKVTTTSMTYPHSKDYNYNSYIEFINFDEECEHDIATGNGFIIGPSTKIKKDLVADDGIYSSKFGQTLADVNPFINRYRCDCREEDGLKGRLNAGLKCPKCGKVCRFVDDNFSYFGWMKLLDEFVVIHPAFYKKIEAFLGKGVGKPLKNKKKRCKIENILDVADAEQKHLTDQENDTKLKDEPFFGIGMLEFHRRFDEIMDYYLKKKPNQKKKEYYTEIYENREKIFIHSIPVFSALLRPYVINNKSEMTFERTNGIYTAINKHVTFVNRNKTNIEKDPYIKNQHLYKIQLKFMELVDEITEILSGKKGDFRCLLGGRYNFSSRNVIVQNPDLRIDEITLPIIGLTILLEQRIKNILCRMYNMTPTEAHSIWYKACIEPNPKISAIVQSIIDDCKAKGMPGLCVLINRNPTITYGGILQMFCIGFTDTYTMAVPLQILKGLNADFDGDVLNILLPINQTFMRLAWEKFNPRNAMYISRNDGYFNPDVSMQRDTLINANTLARCGREYYTPEEIQHLNELFEKKSQIVN